MNFILVAEEGSDSKSVSILPVQENEVLNAQLNSNVRNKNLLSSIQLVGVLIKIKRAKHFVQPSYNLTLFD